MTRERGEKSSRERRQGERQPPPCVTGRQIACDANDRLKLLPPLRTAANVTANKGTVERRHIPAVAQLSPKMSQTGALPLLPLPPHTNAPENRAFSVTLTEGFLLHTRATCSRPHIICSIS